MAYMQKHFPLDESFLTADVRDQAGTYILRSRLQRQTTHEQSSQNKPPARTCVSGPDPTQDLKKALLCFYYLTILMVILTR